MRAPSTQRVLSLFHKHTHLTTPTKVSFLFPSLLALSGKFVRKQWQLCFGVLEVWFWYWYSGECVVVCGRRVRLEVRLCVWKRIERSRFGFNRRCMKAELYLFIHWIHIYRCVVSIYYCIYMRISVVYVFMQICEQLFIINIVICI